jgi:hypothetical protein
LPTAVGAAEVATKWYAACVDERAEPEVFDAVAAEVQEVCERLCLPQLGHRPGSDVDPLLQIGAEVW